MFLLDRVYAVLKEGGRFLFGSPYWQDSPPLQESSKSETLETTEDHEYVFDPQSRMIRFQTVVLGRDGSRQEYRRRSWHPSAEQMAALLYEAGFTIEGQLNDFNYLPYDPQLPGLIWLGRRCFVLLRDAGTGLRGDDPF